jgi:hypothetical protein
MLYDLRNPYDVEKARTRLNAIYARGGVVDITEKKPARSLRQNSYLHLIIAYFATWYGCSPDEAKVDFFKRRCNRELFEREVTSRRGRVTVLRSSANLTVEEMTLAIDRFKNWAASVGCLLPDADNERGLIVAMQEIERNREFLL